MAKLRYFGKEIYYDETKIDINTNFVVYKINFNDENNDGMEVMCNKNKQEFLDIGHDVAQLVLRIILYIMKLIIMI